MNWAKVFWQSDEVVVVVVVVEAEAEVEEEEVS